MEKAEKKKTPIKTVIDNDIECASQHSEETNHQTPNKSESPSGFLQKLKSSWDSSQRSNETEQRSKMEDDVFPVVKS